MTMIVSSNVYREHMMTFCFTYTVVCIALHIIQFKENATTVSLYHDCDISIPCISNDMKSHVSLWVGKHWV